jgi:hypothetical protein
MKFLQQTHSFLENRRLPLLKWDKISFCGGILGTRCHCVFGASFQPLILQPNRILS